MTTAQMDRILDVAPKGHAVRIVTVGVELWRVELWLDTDWIPAFSGPLFDCLAFQTGYRLSR